MTLPGFDRRAGRARSQTSPSNWTGATAEAAGARERQGCFFAGALTAAEGGPAPREGLGSAAFIPSTMLRFGQLRGRRS
jgi:hypothetical protein